jgi:hypothetical protein
MRWGGGLFFLNYEEVLIFEKVNLKFSIILFLLKTHKDSETAFLALGNTLQEFA